MASKRAEVKGHFQLAESLMAAATVKEESSEVEVRRALSTGYYALLHICNAWLAMKNVPLGRRGHHEALQEQIAKKRNPEAAAALTRFLLVRKDADYRPGMFHTKPYFGDLEKFRIGAMLTLDNLRIEFEQYATDVRKFLDTGSK